MIFKDRKFEPSELLSLMSSAPTLAGLCITIVAVINTLSHERAFNSIADNIFACCAVGFLICTYFIFIALRVSSMRVKILLTYSIDIIFIMSLTLMNIASIVLIYQII